MAKEREVTMMKKMVKKLAVLLAAVMMVGSMAGCGASTGDFSTTVVASYGDEDIYLDEANFFLRYQQWFQEGTYWDMYYNYFGILNMWDSESGSGTKTMGQYLKEEVMAQILQTRILVEHADEVGVSLTDADKENIANAVAGFRLSVAPEFFDYAPATDEKITEWFEKNALAVKVWDAVKASKEVTVTDEECQMFTVEYVYVSVTGEDAEVEEGTLVNEELANEVLKRLQAGEEFDAINDALGTNSYTNSYLKVGETATTQLATVGATMKEGDVQMVGDAESGWYIMKCVSELDANATLDKRAEVADAKQEEYFNEVYAGWAAAAKAFEVEKSWNDVKFSGEKIYVEAEAVATDMGDALDQLVDEGILE